MDSQQPAKKRDSQVIETPDEMLNNNQEGENEENSVNKRQKQESHPLQTAEILETIFSNLDVSSLKAVRQVNPLWRDEGAKMLIRKCHVQVPPNVHLEDWGIASKEFDRIIAFLKCKSREMNIPNIIVEHPRDLEVWGFLGVIGPHVIKLKLKILEDVAGWLHNVLLLLPNLKCVTFTDSLQFMGQKGSIMKVLTTVMSEAYKDGKPLLVSNSNSTMALQPRSVKEFEDLEEFVNCRNILIEDLYFAIRPSHLENVENLEARTANIVSKLLSTSQSVCKRLTLLNCEVYFSRLEFPCMTKLTHLELHYSVDPTSSYKFPPTFRFSEHIPNLHSIVIKANGNAPVATTFLELFKETETAQSVKILKYQDSSKYFMIDPCFQVFPNVEELEIDRTACSSEMFRLLWTHLKNIKKLSICMDVTAMGDDVDYLDSAFTGFAPETINWIKNAPKEAFFGFNDLEAMRVFPSILNLTELEVLTIRYHGDWLNDNHLELLEALNALPLNMIRQPIQPAKQMLVISGDYAFKLLPSNAKVVLDVQGWDKSRTGVTAALREVSQLPNVKLQSFNDFF